MRVQENLWSGFFVLYCWRAILSRATRHARMPTSKRNMKIVIAVLLGAVCASTASASDKDTLRDACSALKPASKKSQCFDALERLAPAQAPSSSQTKSIDQPKMLMVNFRAYECQKFEFSELDSFDRSNLEAAICSFDAGNRMSTESSDAFIAKQSDPRIKAGLLQRQIGKMEQCRNERTKAFDLFTRKFPDAMPDCTKLPGKFATPPKDSAPQ